jgi:hypothetical protein
MKKKLSIAFLIAIVCLATIAAKAVFAGELGERSAAITLGTTTGTATWTNTYQYSALLLDRIDIVKGLYATDTVTVKRVTVDNVVTNTINAITLASGAGSYNIVQTTATGPRVLIYGDKITFTSGSTTGATAYLDFIIQKN